MVYFGGVIMCYYDSLLVKVMVYVQIFDKVIVCMDRVLCEFWVCGVVMNIEFVINLLKYLIFLDDSYIIKFIDIMLDLFQFDKCQDCVMCILIYIVDILVNGYLEIVGCVLFLVKVCSLILLKFCVVFVFGMCQLFEDKGVKVVVDWMLDQK